MDLDKKSSDKQLIKFAKDLRKVYKSEKEKRKKLKDAYKQLVKYAKALNETVSDLKESNKNLKNQLDFEEREKLIQKKLIHANKMTSLGTMASGIAHEINNPVNYILSNSQILIEIWDDLSSYLKESDLPESDISIGGFQYFEVFETVEKILSGNIEGLRKIVNITKSLRKFGQRKEIYKSGKMDIKQAIDFSVSVLKKEIKKYTDKFEVLLPENIPILKGDQSAIEQVLINIIQNALQALPDRNAFVIIEVSYTDNVSIKIKDEGTGMDKEIIDRISEPFFTTRTDMGGTGLGMYISYEIIKELSGELVITSEKSKGTEVEIIFPLN